MISIPDSLSSLRPRRLTAAFCICLLGFAVMSRTALGAERMFRPPLEIPLYLAATFGELRSNHFHGGIDIKTQSVEGFSVHAVADGHVARIKVEPGGYGHALYIEHDNGYTSVYGHLSRYADDIEAYVRTQQYARKQFSVDLFPPADKFQVKAGELVAFSGNTGGSMGPHLHFEIRNTATQYATNVLQYGFDIVDRIPPTIRKLGLYALQDEGAIDRTEKTQLYNAVKNGTYYTLPDGHIPVITGDFAVGIETIDMMDDTPNQDGPYAIRLYVDSVLYYRLEVDAFSFDETRALNSLIDYATYVDTRDMIYKMYVSPNNRLPMIKEHHNRGIVSFKEAGLHRIRIEVADIEGNTSVAQFYVRYEPCYTPPISDEVARLLQPVKYKQRQHIVEEGITIDIPAYALYDEEDIRCTVSPRLPGMFTPTYHIHDRHTPLHKRMTLSIRADSIPAPYRSQAVLVTFNNSGTPVSAGGTWKDGYMEGSTYTFGEYTVGLDTVPPVIRPAMNMDGADLSRMEDIRILITDDFSGINSYEGSIDGQWVLFDYDSKNDLLVYTFDEHCQVTGASHTLQMKVTDGVGNLSVYTATFKR